VVVWAFMVLTGARVGEACGLKWSVVDLKQGTAQVVRKIRWDHKTKKPFLEEDTKTSASVRLLLSSDELVSILEEMKEEKQDREFLFTDRNGELLKYNAIQLAFNQGFMALKLNLEGSTHILRHSYATMVLIATRDISLSAGKSWTCRTEDDSKVYEDCHLGL